MPSFSSILYSTLAVAMWSAASNTLVVLAAPNPPVLRGFARAMSFSSNGKSLVKRGDGTFYNTYGGYGACGVPLSDNEAICAISMHMYDSTSTDGNPNHAGACGQCVTVTSAKGSVNCKVMDRCEGCQDADIDMTPMVFNQVGSQNDGRIPVTWSYGCGGSSSPPASSSSSPSSGSTGSSPISAAVTETNNGMGQCKTSSDCGSGMCCSQYGYCGTGPEYCANTPSISESKPDTSSSGSTGSSSISAAVAESDNNDMGKCKTSSDCGSGMCCSQYGYCGTGPEYCSNTNTISETRRDEMPTSSSTSSTTSDDTTTEGDAENDTDTECSDSGDDESESTSSDNESNTSSVTEGSPCAEENAFSCSGKQIARCLSSKITLTSCNSGLVCKEFAQGIVGCAFG